MVTEQSYIQSRLDVVLCLPLHIHDGVENVFKHVLFNVHPKDTSLYLIMGQTKTIKLFLTWLKTKHNVTILWYNIMQFFIRKTRGCNILFNSANKEIFSVLFVPVITWQETTVTIKKKALPPLAWMPCCFPCSMDMLVSHTCSNQKAFHKLENHW